MKKRFTNTGTSTTKNEASTSKLRLSRETLRYLSAPELTRVAGGDVVIDPATHSCWPCETTKN